MMILFPKDLWILLWTSIQETWLGQVKEMQQHCEQGLQYVNIMGIDGLQQPGSSEDSR